MTQVQKKMNLEHTVRILNEIVEKVKVKYGDVWWDTEPSDVVAELLRASEYEEKFGHYTITYNKASRILDNARTSKLHSLANKGMEMIKESWRKSYIN